MLSIILITASFPYMPGEEFLEIEVKYYAKHKDIDFTIMPIHADGRIRKIDKSIKLDTYLIDNKNKSISYKLLCLGKSMLSKLFYKEITSNLVFTPSSVKSFAASISTYQNYYDLFDNYFKNKKDLSNTIIYTYWNDSFTYALQSLKKKYGYKLISRIHGYDIYKERRIDSYMPLKHLFTKNIDKVFTITQSANEYLEKNYGFNKDILAVSRLGTEDCIINTKSTNENSLSVVSCSNLINLKRIDKIIDALAILTEQYPLMNFNWNHIGNGHLEVFLKQYSKQKLSNKKNLKYNFLGYLDNKKVYEFYKNNNIDIFINVSESEGVPVSIMEAMSCHIPVVAPNIGGISEMVINNKNGKLLSKKCEVNEVVKALSNIKFFKTISVREKAYETYIKKYDAKKNYINFITKIKKMR